MNTSTIESNINDQTLTFTFADGERLTADLNEFSDEILRQAALFGLQRKIVNGAAIARDTTNGQSATLAEKRAGMGAVLVQLKAGNWNRVGNGTSRVSGGLLLQALCRLQPSKSPETIAAWLRDRSKDEVTKLRKTPRVALVMAEIRAEVGGADGDGLLDGLLDA